MKDFKSVNHIFYAIQPSKYIPSIFVRVNIYTILSYKVKWVLEHIAVSYSNVTRKEGEGIYLCKFKENKQLFDLLVFKCKEGGFYITEICV